MDLTSLIAKVHGFAIIGISVILALSISGTAIAMGLLGFKFLEGVARQPELAPMLQVKMFIVAGLLYSMTTIGVIMALTFIVFFSMYIQHKISEKIGDR